MDAQNILTQIIEIGTGSINVMLIIVLLGIGSCIRRLLPSLDVSYIPIILMIIGVIVAILLHVPFNPQTDLLNILVEGIASSFATGIVYDKAKDIYRSFPSKNNIE